MASCILFLSLFSSSSTSVSAAQNPSSNDEQSSRRPAHIYGSPKFTSPRIGGQGVVKTCDDAVSWQADRNNTQEPGYYKHHTSSQANISFGQPVVTEEVGAAGPDCSESDGHHADGDGDTDQSPGSLQVLW